MKLPHAYICKYRITKVTLFKINMQRGSQCHSEKCIQVGHHSHVRDLVSCLSKQHGAELNFLSIHLSGYG